MNLENNCKVVAILLTTRCTLKCKHCALGIPYLGKKQEDDEFERIKQEIDALFTVYDYIERIDVSGGEALLHPHIDEIMDYIKKYTNQFSEIRIISNGTIIPKVSLLEVMKEISGKDKVCGFLLDNYGKYSKKVEETKDICKRHHISYKENIYYGDNPYCGGWLDFGDFSCRNYDEKELSNIFNNCHSSVYPCITLFQGKMYFCTRSLMLSLLGEKECADGVDVLNDDCIDVKRMKARKMANNTRPVHACNHCNGFDWRNGHRIEPAQQIEG